MALLRIVTHPNDALRKVASPVPAVDAVVRRILDDMAETMYAGNGVGLAAPQVGHDMRAFVVDVRDGVDLKFFVNPEIVMSDGVMEWREGCLSIPGETMAVQRAAIVRVSALGYDGEPYEVGAHGLLAAAVQHELDHLNGILAIDRAAERKAMMNGASKAKLKSIRKQRRAHR